VLGVGARKTKTDRRDAQVLSEVSTRIELPSVHIPSKSSRERKALCAARDSLVRARTQLINHVRGWLRTQRLRVATGKTETFVSRIRKLKVELPLHIEPVLRAIDSLNQQFEELDKQVVRRANKHPVCRRLMTIPGVGPVTALRFVATVDKVNRFEDARKLEAYLGLTPGEDSSSERKRRTSITKAGPAAMRWTLMQAAWAAQRQKGAHPMLTWMQNIRQRRGAQVATVALARKIAGIMYALWRDKTTYKPMRAALIPVA
jgi:transposase